MSCLKHSGSAFRYLLCLASLFAVFVENTASYAEMVDVDKAEQEAREKYRQRFEVFLQDRNVFGKAKLPDGKKLDSGSSKSRLNKDDKNLFQSDLTYHDYSFDTDEDTKEKDSSGDSETRRLYAFISEHGKVSSAGGSSELERTVYKFHEKYSKEEKDKKKQGAQEGKDFRSVFEVTTEKAKPKKKPQGQNNSNKPQQDQGPPDVARWKLREDVKKEVEEVGERSYETLARAAKDEDAKSDPDAAPNLGFLYEGANRALRGWWNSSVANLGQSRAYQGVPVGSDVNEVQLQETLAKCEDWADRMLQDAAKNGADMQKVTEEVERMKNQCLEMTKVNYDQIGPRFKKDDSGEEKLSQSDAENEDSRERDLRAQVTVLDKAGIDLNQIETNWNYKQKDGTAPVTLSYDENSQPQKEVDLTVADQLDLYNKELNEAADDYDKVRDSLPPGIPLPSRQDILKYQIAPGTRNVMDITKLPTGNVEELGVSERKQDPIPKDYEGLVDQDQ